MVLIIQATIDHLTHPGIRKISQLCWGVSDIESQRFEALFLLLVVVLPEAILFAKASLTLGKDARIILMVYNKTLLHNISCHLSLDFSLSHWTYVFVFFFSLLSERTCSTKLKTIKQGGLARLDILAKQHNSIYLHCNFPTYSDSRYTEFHESLWPRKKLQCLNEFQYQKIIVINYKPIRNMFRLENKNLNDHTWL